MNDKPFIHLFKTQHHFYCYDVNTSSVIRMDQEMYAALQKEELFLNPKLQALLEKGYLKPMNQDIILEHPLTEEVSHYLEDGMQQLILQLTQNCNLRCKYCVYSGSYKNRIHKNKRMNFDLCKKAIDFYHLHSNNSDTIRIGLYGGEPLLEFELIKKITEYSEQIFAGKELRINMTTNATLLNDEILEFLQQHQFDLMISLDGPREVQDRGRVFAESGKGTFDIVMKKLDRVAEKYPEYLQKISFNAVLDKENDFACSSHFFTYDFIKEATVTATGVSDRDIKEDFSLREEFYMNYQYELFKGFLSWVGKLDKNQSSKLIASHKGILKNSIHERITMPYNRTGKCHPNGPCIAGSNRLFVTVDGEFYPCERVSETNPIFNIGNLEHGFQEEKVKELLNIGTLTQEECKHCWAMNLCGMCAADLGEDNSLSREKKLSKCSIAKKEAEQHLKEYCTLREYGYIFED